MPDYLTLNGAELEALSRVIDGEDVRSLQLSRRDSLDNLHADGFLVVSVVPKDGEQFRVCISETGSTVAW